MGCSLLDRWSSILGIPRRALAIITPSLPWLTVPAEWMIGVDPESTDGDPVPALLNRLRSSPYRISHRPRWDALVACLADRRTMATSSVAIAARWETLHAVGYHGVAEGWLPTPPMYDPPTTLPPITIPPDSWTALGAWLRTPNPTSSLAHILAQHPDTVAAAVWMGRLDPPLIAEIIGSPLRTAWAVAAGWADPVAWRIVMSDPYASVLAVMAGYTDPLLISRVTTDSRSRDLMEAHGIELPIHPDATTTVVP